MNLEEERPMAKNGSRVMCTATYPSRDGSTPVKKAPPEVPSPNALERLKLLYGGGNKKPEQN
jgi:hypothetical protein